MLVNEGQPGASGGPAANAARSQSSCAKAEIAALHQCQSRARKGQPRVKPNRVHVRRRRLSLLTVLSPGLRILFDRVGKPEIIRRPPELQLGGTGAVIACNHVGWADSLWMAYAVYPRQLRYMSKEELFDSPLCKMGLAARRVHSDRSRRPFARFDQDGGRYSAERRNHPDFPERHAKGGKHRIQARRSDRRAARPRSACAGLLRRPPAYADRPRHASTPHYG